MKLSPSGTALRDNRPGPLTIVLLVALALVLAFAGSFIFGLRRSDAERQIGPTAEQAAATAQASARVRVEVLNGAGKSGLARVATERLRDAGFDVVQFGNARQITATSTVLDRIGNLGQAAAVGKALDIVTVSSELDSSRLVDVTVILGKDWSTQRKSPPP